MDSINLSLIENSIIHKMAEIGAGRLIEILSQPISSTRKEDIYNQIYKRFRTFPHTMYEEDVIHLVLKTKVEFDFSMIERLLKEASE